MYALELTHEKLIVDDDNDDDDGSHDELDLLF